MKGRRLVVILWCFTQLLYTFFSSFLVITVTSQKHFTLILTHMYTNTGRYCCCIQITMVVRKTFFRCNINLVSWWLLNIPVQRLAGRSGVVVMPYAPIIYTFVTRGRAFVAPLRKGRIGYPYLYNNIIFHEFYSTSIHTHTCIWQVRTHVMISSLQCRKSNFYFDNMLLSFSSSCSLFAFRYWHPTFVFSSFLLSKYNS